VSLAGTETPSASARPTEGERRRRIVEAACQGDPIAREELARSAGTAAYRFALQLVGDRELAGDVAQDAMLRFFASLGRFDPSRPVIPWLFRIVKNRVRDVRRRRVTRSVVFSEVELAGEPLRDATDRGEGPERAAQRAQLREILWQCLGRLAEPQREILVLRDYQDLSYREIAEVLEIPLGTVMSRLHTARRMLRQEVLASGFDLGSVG
jgi:RNA polymerase sigma-70 factor (ECF subfamily)